MTIYYITIFLFLVAGYFYDRLEDERWSRDKNNLIWFSWTLLLIVYGFRYRVGVDWGNYVRVYYRLTENVFSFDTLELGYKFVNLVSYYTNQNISTVIFITTALFLFFTLFGLKKLGLNPFYFFAVVAPYHLVMSGVNYTRQAVALSIFIYALAFLKENKKYSFSFFCFLAGSFHTSALIFILFVFIDFKKRYLFPIMVVFLPVMVVMFSNEYEQYLDTTMESSGLYLRVLFIVAPTFFLVTHVKEVNKLDLVMKRLCYLSIASSPALLLVSFLSSTIADRLSYYFILLSTVCWMVVNNNINFFRARYLNYYGMASMLCSSLLAFTVWVFFTKYIEAYKFKYLLFQ